MVADGPLVKLVLSGLDPATTRVVVTVKAKDAQGMDVIRTHEFTGTPPYDLLGVTFPPGTVGPISISILGYQDTCIVGSGGGTITLNSDEVRELPIMVTKPMLTCGTPAAQVVVQIVAGPNSMGKVTAVMPTTGIDCGQDCEEVYPGGTSITLHAEATQGSFLGWAGACTDSNDCVIDTAATGGLYTVQALFGVRNCTGWCPDAKVPVGFTADLYGIAGAGMSNIVAVGASGKVLRFDGTSWKEEQSNVTMTLRAVTVLRDSNPGVYVAVGDGGNVISSNATTSTWTPATGQGTRLRGVSGYSSGSAGSQTHTVFAVGDSGTILKGNLSALNMPPVGAANSEVPPTASNNKQFNAIAFQVNNGTSKEYLAVADSAYAMRYISAYNFDEGAVGVSTQNLFAAWYSKMRMVAVGANSAIVSRAYNFGWQAWKVETAPATGVAMYGLWGSSETNMIAVGEGGKIWRWDGTSWSSQTNPSTKILRGVWGTGSNNIYAVGDMGTILHYLP